MQKQFNLNLNYVGIVTIASNSGSARTSSSESEVEQTSTPHVIFYRTNGVRRSENNLSKYLVLFRERN
jgi:hypothetical protein